jgi:hypothetical protein
LLGDGSRWTCKITAYRAKLLVNTKYGLSKLIGGIVPSELVRVYPAMIDLEVRQDNDETK